VQPLAKSVKRRLVVLALLSLSLAALLYTPVARRVRALQLLSTLGAPTSDAQRPLVETDLVLPGRDGPIRARLYQRPGRPGPGLVIAHGVHYRGIEERRLVPFARALARAGSSVLTPELRDLTEYRITQQGTSIISDTVRYLSARKDLVASPRVGLLGFSFAGGLALVAASDRDLGKHLSYVASVGGHHDLGRVMRFLVRDEIETVHGLQKLKAHDYGLVVLIHDNLERFVDPPDRDTMRAALRVWLHEDKQKALALASQRVTASGETLYQRLESGRLREFGPRLEAILGERSGELSGLSPRGRLARIGVPVYLLHGSADSVIPPTEVAFAELELAHAEHLALVTPLLEHVEVSRHATLRERLALVNFVAHLL
jgi:pimeloyl-ACP methyl ester carboxylesterase